MRSSECELVGVMFVGGGLNGVRTLMLRPERRMHLKGYPVGDLVVYVVRFTKLEIVDGVPRLVMVYAPEDISDGDFALLMGWNDAMNLEPTKFDVL